MKVSIVTISYNQADFLEETIKSVLNQDYDDIEYIIVDPGSTDGSREIIERYRSKIAKIIYEPDEGPADGLNRGFSFASGDIYAYLNSDDILLPGGVSKIAKVFERRQETDVVSGHGNVIDKDGELIYREFSSLFSLKAFTADCGAVVQQATFFRSNAFRDVGGFNIKNTNCWDGELMVDMGLNGARFAVINSFIGGFRMHENSISGSARLKEEFLQTIARIKKRVGLTLTHRQRLIFCIKNKLMNPISLCLRIIDGVLSHKGRKAWKIH
ncbi:MAG: glycosyltransferase [Zetaproteobacteria bacterium]|nr:glycosyltransferase [Zetaproteobacteria bacterium]